MRAAPSADARATREVAMATDSPNEAAAEWETALTELVAEIWDQRLCDDRLLGADRGGVRPTRAPGTGRA